MKKIPTLFERDQETRLVTPKVTPECEWVLKGAGTATVKWDGSACALHNGLLLKRYDARAGKMPPAEFIAAQSEPDPITGHWPGWIPVGDGPDDRWHREALANWNDDLVDGTYELVGPKVQGNPYGLADHLLIRHGGNHMTGFIPAFSGMEAPRTFEGLRDYLEAHEIEGIVWWIGGEPGAKLKRRDFGFEWPVKAKGTEGSSG